MLRHSVPAGTECPIKFSNFSPTYADDLHILLKYLQAKATYKWNMSNLSNFLRMASFAKIHLFDWLDHPVEVEKPPPEEQIQLAL